MGRALLAVCLFVVVGSPASGQGSAEVATLATTCAEDPSWVARRSAVEALGRMGPTWPAPVRQALTRALVDVHPEVRRAAAKVVRGSEVLSQEACAFLEEVLSKQEDPLARVRAVEALGALGMQHAGYSVPLLIEALAVADEYPDVRESAVAALADAGWDDERAAPALVGSLSDQDADVRLRAAEVLGSPDWIQRGGVPAALIAAAEDRSAEVRCRAVEALGDLGSAAAPETVPVLTRALSDEDEFVRARVCEALADLGTAAGPATPALIEAVSDPYDRVRAPAALALGVTGREREAVPALAAALFDRNPWVVNAAEEGLARAGPSLKAKGTVLWWVVPYAHWRGLLVLLLVLLAVYALRARVPAHRPASASKRLLDVASTACLTGGLAGWAVHHAVTRGWAEGFLPDAVTLVPFPVAAVLTSVVACALPAIWVCQRKPPAEVPEQTT